MHTDFRKKNQTSVIREVLVTAGNSQPSFPEVHRPSLVLGSASVSPGQGENATFIISTPWPQKQFLHITGQILHSFLFFDGTEVALCHLPKSLMFW